MKRCIIIAAGELHPDSLSLSQYTGGELVICADAGYDHALSMGIKPHTVIGDFDSVRAAVAPGVESIRRPAHKDETDLQLAIQLGFERGCGDFLLLGVTGGRTDHMLGNLQLLTFIAERIGSAKAIGHDGIYYSLHNSSVVLKGKKGDTFSLISVSDISTGVYIRGGEYPLTDATVLRTVPVGISNRFSDSGCVQISVREGTLLLICPNT